MPTAFRPSAVLHALIPKFYQDRAVWQEITRASISMAMHRFSTKHMLTLYYNLMYQPSTSLRKIKHDVLTALAIQ